MEGVDGAQRSALQLEKEVLCPAVHVAGQLDAVVHTLVEPPEDSVLPSIVPPLVVTLSDAVSTPV